MFHMDGLPGRLCNWTPVVQPDTQLLNWASGWPTLYTLQPATQPGRDLAIPIYSRTA